MISCKELMSMVDRHHAQKIGTLAGFDFEGFYKEAYETGKKDAEDDENFRRMIERSYE